MENQQLQHTAANEDIVNLRALLAKYLKKWYWFVISIFVCVAVAFVYLKLALPQYSVRTTILLRDDNASNPLAQLAIFEGMGNTGASKEVEDEIQVLTTKTIASQLIRSLGLETEYYAKKGFSKYRELYPVAPMKLNLPAAFNDTLSAVLSFEIKQTKKGYEIRFTNGKFKEKYTLDNLTEAFTTPYGEMRLTSISPMKEKTKYRIKTYPHRILTEVYSQRISVGTVNKKSNAIAASMTSPVPGKAKVVLDKLIDLYNQDVVNDKNLVGRSTAEFVDQQIVNVEKELSQIEGEIEKYKKENSITDISSEAKLFLESMGEYDKQLAEIQTQINLIAYIDEYVKRDENRFGLIPANLGISDMSLITLIKEYNDALLERMQLLRTTNEQNPIIAQMENTLSVIRASIITSIKSLADGLDIAKADLLAKGSQFTSKIKEVPRQEREYIEMMRRQEVSQTLYVYLLQKKKENELTLATTLPPAKILDKAYVSLTPVSPRRMMTLLLALMLGGCIPIVVIYLLDLLDNKIRDKKEYKSLVHVPYLGSIPVNKSDENLIVGEGKVTPAIEMFRQLRTNLQFMMSGKKNPVILVTSSVSGEGKSFISTNLAASLSLMDKKVALLGMDIRNPILGQYMHLPHERQGITMYLSDPDVQVADIIHYHPQVKNLAVIQAGPVPPNPAELLMSLRLEELIGELKQSFDYIIIDSAPVGVVSDTFQINRVVDNTVYVSRQDYTTREVAAFINELYGEQKLNNMSVVLNGTDEVSTYYGYNHKKYMKVK